MTTNRRYRALLALFGFAVICTTLSASRRLVEGLMPFWVMCCQTLGMSASGDVKFWMTSLALVAAVTILLLGLGVFVRRSWKTYQFVSHLRSAAMAVAPAHLARLLADLGLSPFVTVLATETPVAFCYGLLRPRLCLSTGLAETLTNKELKAVLLHEDHHRRQYDPLRGLLAEVLGTMFFFLPVAAELRDLFLTSTELEADRHATSIVGRSALAGALHKIISHPHAVRLALPGIAGLSATDARIAELLGDRPTALRLSIHSLLASSAIIMLVCILAL
jgi:Zn-dependent protease with chaperone function